MKKPIAYITGASSGIGRATALKLTMEGFRIIASARRSERLKQLEEEVGTIGGDIYTQVYDIRNREAVNQAINALPDEWKNVEVLVNNAGLAAGMSSFEEGDLDDWDTMIDTNIKGLLYITRKLVNGMISRGKGHIINIGSIAGKETYPNGNVYCASKTAVDALNKSMRIDLLKHGIKVSAVNPGAVETEFSIVRFKGDIGRAAKVYEGFDNLIAEDIADAVCWVLTRPTHVNINDLIIMPTAQAQAGIVHKKI